MIAFVHPKQQVQAYIEGVLSGEIVAGKYVRLAVERHIHDLEHAWERGFKFDEHIATRACAFFPTCCRHSIGEWAGERLELSGWQMFCIWVLFGWRRIDTGLRRFRRAYKTVGRKNGKGLALDTPLPTPTGWTTMGQVKAGDTLFDDNGLPCSVVRVSEDRFLDCYEVRFSNKERIVCDGDHLWKTEARAARPGGGHNNSPCASVQVRSVRELRKTLTYGSRGDRNHSMMMPHPLVCDDSLLPIDPYLLGAWLGDGHTACARITCCKDDAAILDGVQAAGLDIKLVSDKGTGKAGTFQLTTTKSPFVCVRGHDQRVNGSLSAKRTRCRVCQNEANAARKAGQPTPPKAFPPFQEVLRNTNLIGNKHIPPAYLRASYSQRLALLQGLMDTDGTINKNGTVLSFDTTCEALRDGVCELLATFGLKFSVTKRTMRCNRRDVPGFSYRVQFMAFRDQVPVFRLARKLSRMRVFGEVAGQRRSRSVQIISIEPVSSVVTRCIEVDSPSHQFLCGRTMLPTHNTTWAAALALLLMFADEPFEPGAQIFVAATKEDQAKIMHREAVNMVKASPTLSKRARVRKSPSSIVWEEKDSFFRPLGSDSEGTDGLNPHGVLEDELHAWRERHRGLKEKLSTGGGARRQPLEVIVTTAGDDTSELWKEEDKYAVDVLESVVSGNIIDDTYFAFIARIDEEDDPFDEECWGKANPNLGVSVKLEYLRESANRAKNKPSETNQFIRYHANRAVAALSREITVEDWAKGAKALTIANGAYGHGGLDIGRTNDWAAIAACFPISLGIEDVDGVPYERFRYEVMAKAWTVKHGDFPVDREPFRTWIANGWLEACDGDQVDFMEIEQEIVRWHERYQIVSWAYDPVQARLLAGRLLNVHGINMFSFNQSHKFYNEPCTRFVEELRAGRVSHGNDQVLSWQAGNVMFHRNHEGLVKPDKSNRISKIDGMVALLMAFSECLFAAKNERNYYDSNPVEMA